jgi:hypothetical protein
MSQLVTISSITANTPVEIYYCDVFSANCVYVSSETVFPYQFVIPSPYDETNFLVKIIDSEGCENGDIIYVTPTATPFVSGSQNLTPTPTKTPTPTNTKTPTNTPTNTLTSSNTPTFTPTPTLTSGVVSHIVGLRNSTTIIGACSTPNTIVNYYTYISEANTVPVIGVTVYTFYNNGILYLPLVGNDLWYKLYFGGLPYAVNVSSSGQINSFELCI